MNAELGLLLVLAAVQFTHILDFVIMMPLGPQFMRAFSMGPSEFGLLVSSYTFSASASGLLAAFFIDRYDRKKALVFLYSGFIVGTLLCAIAQGYWLLLVGRVVAGAFGGILNASVFSVIGDRIPETRRGAATGTIMSAFSVASILGVPFGLYLANHWGWQTPFLALAVFSGLVLAAALKVLPSMREHLIRSPGEDTGFHPLRQVRDIITERNHLWAFGLMLLVMTGGFSIIPYLSPFMVSNVKLPETDLPYIYLAGGLFTFFTSRGIGALADRFGKIRVFTIMCVLYTVPAFLLTILGPTSLGVVLTLTTIFMICNGGRLIPAMSLITSSVEPRRRGSFMSVLSSVQSMSSGVASLIAGMVLGHTAAGELLHFERVGILAVAATLLSIPVARKLRLTSVAPPQPVPAQAVAPHAET